MKIEDIFVGQIVIDKDCERIGKLKVERIDKYNKVFVRTLDEAEEYYYYCVFNTDSLIEVGINDSLFSASVKKDMQTLKDSLEQYEAKQINISELYKDVSEVSLGLQWELYNNDDFKLKGSKKMKIENIKVGMHVTHQDFKGVFEVTELLEGGIKAVNAEGNEYSFGLLNLIEEIPRFDSSDDIRIKVLTERLKEKDKVLEDQQVLLKEKDKQILKLRKKIKNLKKANQDLRGNAMDSWDDAFTFQ